jgi:hypothetical protein
VRKAAVAVAGHHRFGLLLVAVEARNHFFPFVCSCPCPALGATGSSYLSHGGRPFRDPLPHGRPACNGVHASCIGICAAVRLFQGKKSFWVFLFLAGFSFWAPLIILRRTKSILNLKLAGVHTLKSKSLLFEPCNHKSQS